MAESQEPPVAGLVAGKYSVERLIGRGGMGAVWEGRHATLGTRVAIKFIDPGYAGSKEAHARFLNEARAAASIQSKHAIRIHDHGVTDDGRPYIVMELLEGEPLAERIRRLGHISLPETARVLSQVCRALQRAHNAGIIHRDLKPENIFLVRSTEDDEEIAKVLDFGVAKIRDAPGANGGLTNATKTGAVLGTPNYMSPEQARGLRSIDHRSDLWSLGVIAYQCLTGVLPFDGESVGDLLVKICTAPLPIPSLTVPGLPPAFDVWFARALEREPEGRYASATELADALTLASGIDSPSGAQAAAAMRPALEEPRDGERRPIGVTAPMSSRGLTSAPFVAPARSSASGRGALVGVLAAAVVGGSIGVAAVIKVVGASHARPPRSNEGVGSSTGPASAIEEPTPTAGAGEARGTAATTGTAAPGTEGVTLAPPAASVTASAERSEPPPSHSATAPPTHPNDRPGPKGKASAAPAPTVRAPPPPPPRQPPAPSKNPPSATQPSPPPTSADPGY